MTFKWTRLQTVRLKDKTGTIIGSLYRLNGMKLAAMEMDNGDVFIAHEATFEQAESKVRIVEKFELKDTIFEELHEGAKHTVHRTTLVPK